VLGKRQEASTLLDERIANDALVGIAGNETSTLNTLDPRA
jgi:hypothetical protein